MLWLTHNPLLYDTVLLLTMNRAAASIVGAPLRAFYRWNAPESLKTLLVFSVFAGAATYSVLRGAADRKSCAR